MSHYRDPLAGLKSQVVTKRAVLASRERELSPVLRALLPPSSRASLAELQQVAERFLTIEFVTIDAAGRPIVWPVTPYYRPSDGCIDVTTGVGYPKKADDAARNPHVALLFSDPTGSGVADAPTVLVQGTARVDESDLDARPAVPAARRA